MINCSTVPLTTEIALSDRARYSEQRLCLLLLMSVHSVAPGWLIITDVNRARASGLKLLVRNAAAHPTLSTQEAHAVFKTSSYDTAWIL